MLLRIRKRVLNFFVNRKIFLPCELRNAYKISKALEVIQNRWGEFGHLHKTEANSPVFIFSAGWRSGSTLMQRLVVSSGEITIWGEPLGELGIIPRLAYTLIDIKSDYPANSYFPKDVNLQNLTNQWIANLTPTIYYFWLAHRSFFVNWLGQSADSKLKVSRWGLKEVRLTIDHAHYLKWLFPDARFIFIYRNLFDAYKSWKGNFWYSAWPGYTFYSPVIFARHWKLLLSGFLKGYKSVDGILVKFEDLLEGKIPLKDIAAHIKVKTLDPEVLNKKIASPKGYINKKSKKINLCERIILQCIGGSLLKKLGYKSIKS